jgi:hypothetical protein
MIIFIKSTCPTINMDEELIEKLKQNPYTHYNTIFKEIFRLQPKQKGIIINMKTNNDLRNHSECLMIKWIEGLPFCAWSDNEHSAPTDRHQ